MIKAIVLYGHPEDSAAFEQYYSSTHLPIAAGIKGVEKFQLTKFIAAPGAQRPLYYRMAELYFSDPAIMQQAMSSPEGQATLADLSNFATGGFTMMTGNLEN